MNQIKKNRDLLLAEFQKYEENYKKFHLVVDIEQLADSTTEKYEEWEKVYEDKITESGCSQEEFEKKNEAWLDEYIKMEPDYEIDTNEFIPILWDIIKIIHS